MTQLHQLDPLEHPRLLSCKGHRNPRFSMVFPLHPCYLPLLRSFGGPTSLEDLHRLPLRHIKDVHLVRGGAGQHRVAPAQGAAVNLSRFMSFLSLFYAQRPVSGALFKGERQVE